MATLHVLTLRGGPPSLELRGALARVAALPAPELPGLRARHWRAEPRALVGRYLFDDPAALAAFRRAPARDPALALLPPIEDAGVELLTEPEVAHLDRPVFLISAPRTGSTLLYETLSRARALWTAGGESHGILEGVRALHPARRDFASDRLDERDADPAAVAAVRAGFLAEARDRSGHRYLELPPAARPERLRLLEKTPENALRVAFLRAAFPDARFVLLHRDPRQSVSSIVSAWHHDGFVRFPALPGWSRGRWCFLLPPGWRALDRATISEVAAAQWRAAYEHALDDLAAVPRERWTSVDHAELVAAPERTIRRLCALLELEVDPELAAAIARPLPLSSTTLSPPSPIKWRSNPHLRASSLAPLGPLGGRLRDLAGSAPPPPPTAPDLDPSVRFACFLRDLEPRPPGPGLVVHPALVLQRGASVPLALARRARCRDRFLSDHPIAWTEDPATAVLQPFWLERGQLHRCAELVPGRAPPSSLEASLAAHLAAAGILIEPAAYARRRAEGDALAANAGHDLARARYCVLPRLLHPAQVAALARYVRALVASGGWALGDAQVERRHGWHDELVTRFHHLQLAAFTSRLAGEELKPTYCYTSAYQAGAALAAHADRKQCELTMSLLIEQAADAPPWPLWFEAPGGRRSVTLAPGDAVLFRGCELPHWREAAPPGQHATMLLFHYVPADFEGVLA